MMNSKVSCAGAMALAFLAGACNQAPESTGEVGVSIVPPAEISVTGVAYRISGVGVPTIEGQIPADPETETISSRIVGVPADQDLTLDLSATAEGFECVGTTDFSVAPSSRTQVVIVLQCRAVSGESGDVDIDGSFNVCPQIQSLTVSPTAAMVGEAIALAAVAADEDGDALAYAWSSASGSFSDAAAASTSFTCDTAGTAVIALSVDDGNGCADSVSTEVTCLPAECGDGVVSPGEECDDGNTEDGDGCSAVCVEEVADACIACEEASCRDFFNVDVFDECYNAVGVAVAGPAVGTAKSELCLAYVTCARASGCAAGEEQACYCGEGVSINDCLRNGGAGACVAEAEAAAESTDSLDIAVRFDDPAFALGNASRLLRCDVRECSGECL